MSLAKHMQILAHRGVHGAAYAPNSYAAFEQAVALGFGVEVDVRDQNGELVVAHDANEAGAYPFSKICALMAGKPQAMAINIKSCGLQGLLKETLSRHGISRYFTFDMAVADLWANVKSGITSFTRQSDFEREVVLAARAQGVWLDMFETDWVDGGAIAQHMAQGRDVALVSPELHGRAHMAFWGVLKRALPVAGTLYLCTDFPQEADRFFND